ncbi:MAG: hypothetical protein ACI9XP_000716 [Lentimonas sp.]|jgi:hypothetical protein
MDSQTNFVVQTLKSLATHVCEVYFLETAKLPFNQQEEIFEKNLFDWKGDIEQVDDIILIGVKI